MRLAIRFNPTSGLRDELDGSPCSFEYEDSSGTKKRLSRRQCREFGFTPDAITWACSHIRCWFSYRRLDTFCDRHGAKIEDHTLICGAPQCCPICCEEAKGVQS